PLAMTSTDAIAGVLVELQLQRQPRDYLDRRNDYINRVTAEDVDRVIKKWFNPDGLTISMVGKPDNMTPTETHEQVHQ
ncbi:MAG TPA: insulinase family protein, partial [Alphaproteobacteria bacterium]|nr:insulinase family protein [Alphaproteobacteria bacterium]